LPEAQDTSLVPLSGIYEITCVYFDALDDGLLCFTAKVLYTKCTRRIIN
jgi:hypothetical protein